jgi:ankyrin repeat protein
LSAALINEQEEDGFTAVHLAAQEGHLNVLEVL